MCLLIKYGEDSDCKYKRDGREREEPRLTMVRTKPTIRGERRRKKKRGTSKYEPIQQRGQESR